MQGLKIRILPGKTFRLNLALTKGFNADFDGDEMNLHLTQAIEAQAELINLTAPKFKIISSQESKPIVVIVQDSLLGSFRMTLGVKLIPKHHFFNIAMKAHLHPDNIISKLKKIRRVFKLKGKKAKAFHGKGLFSLILPDDLYYEKENKAHVDEPVVKIYEGVLYEGTLDKKILGGVSNSLIQIIYKEYGQDVAQDFINKIQFIAVEYLTIYGFSIGMEDCMIHNKDNIQRMEDEIEKCFLEADAIEKSVTHPGIREVRILAALNKAKDLGQKIAKESISEDNNFLSTIKSGSKGDWHNMMSIVALLGQQNLMGQKRAQPVLNNGKRTLVYFPFDNLPISLKYKSRGFIKNNYKKGIDGIEFFFHAKAGREGVVDTSANTPTTGYIQRKIIKLTEDIQVKYGNVVMDNTNIYQYLYNEDGFNPKELLKVNGELEPYDLGSMINKLNHKYSNKKTNKLKITE